MENNFSDNPIPFLNSYNQKKLKVGFFIDRILNIFCPRQKNTKYEESPKKILVIQSHLIGDLMMAVPFLKALRARYPKARVYLLANHFALDLLGDQDLVDVLWTVSFPWGIRSYSLKNMVALSKMILKLRKEKFDLALDAQIDFRNIFLLFLAGAKRRIGYDIVGGRVFLTDIPEFPKKLRHLLEARFSLLSYLGIKNIVKKIRLEPSAETKKWVDAYFQEKGLVENSSKIVAIHPGASTSEKLWPSERFVQIIQFLLDHKYLVVLIEGPQEKAVVNEINDRLKKKIPVLKTSLRNLVAFFSKCCLVVCLDSAASHLASAAGTSAVVLYGPQWPFSAKPWDDHIVPVWIENMNCRPCVYNRCKNNICMTQISASLVIEAIQKLLTVEINSQELNTSFQAKSF